jgi:hypothetical protein
MEETHEQYVARFERRSEIALLSLVHLPTIALMTFGLSRCSVSLAYAPFIVLLGATLLGFATDAYERIQDVRQINKTIRGW